MNLILPLPKSLNIICGTGSAWEGMMSLASSTSPQHAASGPETPLCLVAEQLSVAILTSGEGSQFWGLQVGISDLESAQVSEKLAGPGGSC